MSQYEKMLQLERRVARLEQNQVKMTQLAVTNTNHISRLVSAVFGKNGVLAMLSRLHQPEPAPTPAPARSESDAELGRLTLEAANARNRVQNGGKW